jgi:phosphoribosylanthranilate isomerase
MPRVRVKICGVKTPADIRAAAEAGADAVGINFHPPSPRYVDPCAAAPLVRALPPFLDAAGVFVEQPVRQMCAVAYQLGLRSVQWVGEMPPIEDTFPFGLVAAFRVKDAADLDTIRGYVQQATSAGHPPAAVLLDAHVPGQYGGTGQTAPWDLLAGFDPGVPLILAGGLTPENVADAIRAVRPYGVDVASGVESEPGRKDPDKVRRFVEAVRAANDLPGMAHG